MTPAATDPPDLDRPVPATTVDELFARIPEGWSVMVFGGRRFGVTRTTVAGGRAQKLYAEELGGTVIVSANLYDGVRLQPCEMPAARVLAFVTEAIADPSSTVPGGTGSGRGPHER